MRSEDSRETRVISVKKFGKIIPARSVLANKISVLLGKEKYANKTTCLLVWSILHDDISYSRPDRIGQDGR